MIAYRDYNGLTERLLTRLLAEEDQVMAIQKWLADEVMRVEAEVKLGSSKVKHSKKTTHFSC